MGRDRRSHVCKCLPLPNRDAGAGAAVAQNRDLLACMVASAPSRIASVIGSNHQEVVGTKLGEEFRQSAIKQFQSRSVTRDVSAVAVQAVEVDEIGEQE